jgi:hypothetical protein
MAEIDETHPGPTLLNSPEGFPRPDLAIDGRFSGRCRQLVEIVIPCCEQSEVLQALG